MTLATKFHSKKITVDGITFNSKKEYRRYCELIMLEKAGQIQNLELQKVYELIPAQYETFERYGKNGNRLKDGSRCIEKACVYKADFVYTENGKTVVEDTKGFKTKDYIIKRKLMLHIHGIRIKEI